jgi:hypothetical protein
MTGMGKPPILLIGLLHIFNKPLDILVEPLNSGAKWSIFRLVHLTAASSSRLCFTSTQASRWRHMPPPNPSRTPIGFWGPSPKTVHWWFWGPNNQTSLQKRICYASSTILTRVIDYPWPPDHQVLLRLYLTWSTRSTPLHVNLLVDVSKCQPHTVNLPATLVPRSKPYVRSSPLLVQWHDTSLLDLLYDRRLSPCSTHAHQHNQETFAHTLMLGLVSDSNESGSSLDNHSSQLDTYGHISTIYSQL